MISTDIRYSLIIPVYNGSTFFVGTVVTLLEWVRTEANRELIIVNDGSVDNTGEIIAKLGAEPGVIVMQHEVNKGKGAALRTGLAVARGAIVAFTDADLPYGLELIPEMGARLLQTPGLGMVYGSRSHERSQGLVNYGWLRKIGRAFFSGIIKWSVASDVLDSQCGIKVFSQAFAREVTKRATIDRFAFDIELFVIAQARGYGYADFPVSLTTQRESSVRIVVDTLRMLNDIVKIKKRLKTGQY